METLSVLRRILKKFHLLGRKAVTSSYTIKNPSEAIVISQGREQFKKLVDKGLSVPVALL